LLARFVVARIFQAIIALLVIATLVFLMARATGDPADLLIKGQWTAADIAQARHRLGLDKPMYEQYWQFLTDTVRGNLGDSIADRGHVAGLIKERFPNTIKLGVLGLFLATVVGILLGVAAAVKRNTWVDRSARVVAVLGQSMPSFWVALLLIMIFGVWLHALPTAGMGGPSHYVLPAIVLAFFQLPMIMRLMRSSLLEVLDTEYVKLARVKGLAERVVTWKHGFRNAMIPQITNVGIQLSYAVMGSIIVETIFSWPGIGMLAYQAMLQRDYPVIQGTVMTVAVFVVGMSFIVDLVYQYVDPRIRLAHE
jgi:peptide/nickel transport system permease protein